jgi:myo-inositol-1(or 4)-monophosphatase
MNTPIPAWFEETPLLVQLLEVVRQAGGVLLSYWPGAAALRSYPAEVVEKSDGSPVSNADLESNQLLLAGLHRLCPDDAVLSEECPPDAARLARARRTWVVDPLDGTRAFLAGRDDFAVLLGLCSDHRPTTGIMHFPARRQELLATAGHGSWLNGERVRVSTSAACRAASVYIRNFDCPVPPLQAPAMDSSVALLLVAQGVLDGAVLGMQTFGEWDIVAPAAAIEAAGGRVSDEEDRPLRCATGDRPCRYFVASNGRCHEQLLRLIQPG